MDLLALIATCIINHTDNLYRNVDMGEGCDMLRLAVMCTGWPGMAVMVAITAALIQAMTVDRRDLHFD